MTFSFLRSGPTGWLVLIALLLPSCGEPGAVGSVASPAAERREAPDFALASLTGETVRLADLRGKTVIIDFWATWCPPCEFQVPELNAFWKAHQAEGDVVVLGISVDIEAPAVVSAWAAEKDVQYPVLVGGEELARRFGALGFPTLYVITPDGTVEAEHVGLIEVGDLEEALARQRARAEGEDSQGG